MSLIIICIIILLLIILITMLYYFRKQQQSSEPTSDYSTIRDIMNNDSRYHRLLMIEIINAKKDQLNYPLLFNIESVADTFSSTATDSIIPTDVKISSDGKTTPNLISNSTDFFPRNAHISNDVVLPSEAITFNKISNSMTILGKSMINSFGITTSQKIATLMHKRNETLREYYKILRNAICNNENCYITDNSNLTDNNNNNNKLRPIFPNSTWEFNIASNNNNHIVDVTTVIQRKLEAITREIVDNIAASFHMRDVDQQSIKNRPITHFQRLFNLLSMYDKELINQAKSYSSHHYDISMNCSQSSLDLSHHISDELILIMKQSQHIIKTFP